MSRARRVDQNAVATLDLYTENVGDLYPQFKSILAAMKKKMREGKLKVSTAWRMWMPWYDAGARRYAREVSAMEARTFTLAVRRKAAGERAAHEYGRIVRGEWD